MRGGAIVNGIRHEDVEQLSFKDETIDLIVSNDVFEHIPHPKTGFKECCRVLKKGGVMLATIPFDIEKNQTIARAEIINDQLIHHMNPQFHGNPILAEGSLVFTDFGWDLLVLAREIGFSDSMVQIYRSINFGHLGGGQLIFQFTK